VIKTIHVALSFLVSLMPISSVFRFELTKGNPATIVVPDDFATIQEAINSAADGDTVFVKAGTYYEHVVANKTVTLVGENRDTTIIDGSFVGVVVNVTRDGVDISGFTIRQPSAAWNIGGPPYGAGIYMGNVTNCTISQSMLTSNGVGIQMEYGADTNIIANNTITNCGCCIGTYDASWNSFTGNTVTGLRRGFGFNVNSDYNIISGNTISVGEWVIAMHICYYDNITENCLANGLIGIFVPQSSYNNIYHNSIVNNGHQAATTYRGSVPLLNYWDDGYPNGGNYWSNCTGVDTYRGVYQNETNSDGIGDVPCAIDGNNTDHYPLMKPYAGPHDIGIDASVSKTIVVQGYDIPVNTAVKIVNYGIETETFNFTCQMIGMFDEQIITLTSRNSTTFTFAWNTVGYATGNYDIIVCAQAVPNETDIQDNNLTAHIHIGVPGDVDGNNIVNMTDLYSIALHFGGTRGASNYVANFDIEDNGIFNMLDLYAAALHYGQTDSHNWRKVS